MKNDIAVGIVKQKNGKGGNSGYNFQNSIIEVTSLLLNISGTKIFLGEQSKWWIEGKVITNPVELTVDTIPSLGLIRQDRLLLDKLGNLTIQPGIPSFAGGKSYLRPYDLKEYVQLSILNNSNGTVSYTDPIIGDWGSLNLDEAEAYNYAQRALDDLNF